MNHKTLSGYRVNETSSDYFRQYSPNQTIEIWADIFKESDEPEFLGDGDSKLAKIVTTAPVNVQKLRQSIEKAAPGYKLMAWWIPETEDQF